MLAVGRGDVANVAAAYGFKAVATTAGIAAAHPPSMLPFSGDAARAVWAAEEGGAADGGRVRDASMGSAAAHIAAVLVFHDPADW